MKRKMIILTFLACWIIFLFTCEITYTNKKKCVQVQYNGLLWVALDYWSIRKYESFDKPKRWIDFKSSNLSMKETDDYEEILKLLQDKFGWNLTDSLTATGKKLVHDTLKAKELIKNRNQ